jgi:hypothetical protein
MCFENRQGVIFKESKRIKEHIQRVCLCKWLCENTMSDIQIASLDLSPKASMPVFLEKFLSPENCLRKAVAKQIHCQLSPPYGFINKNPTNYIE